MAAASSSSAPPWIELPEDVTANILRRLGAIEILESAQSVCTTWRRVCQDPAMWRVIEIRNLDCKYERDVLNAMCYNAVDRSQGKATDIFLVDLGDDQLMNYISQRSTHLKCLTIAGCYDISGDCLSEAVKKFPELEELHLIQTPFEPKDIEAIAISCPAMKSFTYNEFQFQYPLFGPSSEEDEFKTAQDNEFAVAVAKNMPNLLNLGLLANSMTNTGLQAVLDGCPQLESLDIRKCFNVDLGGDLERRCREQIKHLRRPYESTDDYEWPDESSWYAINEGQQGQQENYISMLQTNE